MNFPWGTVPDVVGGFGTTGAFLFGVGAYAYDKWRNRQARAREQAVLFDGWVASISLLRDDPGVLCYEVTVALANGNPHAMRSVQVHLTLAFEERRKAFLDFYADVGTVAPMASGPPAQISMVATIGKQSLHIDPPLSSNDIDGAAQAFQVTLVFTDTGGTRWKRLPSGEVSKFPYPARQVWVRPNEPPPDDDEAPEAVQGGTSKPTGAEEIAG